MWIWRWHPCIRSTWKFISRHRKGVAGVVLIRSPSLGSLFLQLNGRQHNDKPAKRPCYSLNSKWFISNVFTCRFLLLFLLLWCCDWPYVACLRSSVCAISSGICHQSISCAEIHVSSFSQFFWWWLFAVLLVTATHFSYPLIWAVKRCEHKNPQVLR